MCSVDIHHINCGQHKNFELNIHKIVCRLFSFPRQGELKSINSQPFVR